MAADTVAHVQARHVRRCSITLGAAANLLTAVIAALEAQLAGRGAAIRPYIMGGRIITSSAGFTLGDSAALSAMITVATATKYDEPAVTFLNDTWVAGSGTMIVAVYFTGDPIVP